MATFSRRPYRKRRAFLATSSGVPAVITAADGTATGVGAATAEGSFVQIVFADGVAASSGVANATGAATNTAQGQTATGIGGATATGAATKAAQGQTATGIGAANAVGAATKEAQGQTATGVGAATGTGAQIAAAQGQTATGLGTATATGAATNAAQGQTATGLGAATAGGAAIGAAAGQTATGIGAATAGGAEIIYLRPDGDTTTDNWTDQGGGTSNIFQSIDEAESNDTDFVQSPVLASETADLTVRLCEGGTTIAEWTHANVGESFVTATQTLTTPQYEAIVNVTNLFVELDDNSGNTYRCPISNPASGVAEPIKLHYRYKKLAA